jgi:NADH:ubiquinone oxidoreductase subunit F (NADH-binding)
MRRVLPPRPFPSLADYEAAGGGAGLAAATRLGPAGIIEHLRASGLRGRGGAGFPTGRKWETVRAYAAPAIRATVVVNGAEGEPGSFKDRIVLRWNPYAVLEGALIAAAAVGADRIVVAIKRDGGEERAVVQRVLDELRGSGWADDVELLAFEGPSEYLYGEETALLEAIDGRPPFPRVGPPYRFGVEEVSEDDSGEPAQIVAAAPGDATGAPPTLVNNVETLANVPGILAHGPQWFRSVGTDESPGTVVCTVSGCTVRQGVGEVVMGTPLRLVIDELGGGARPGRRVVAAMSGVANPLVTADALDTPVSYEGMEAVGSGLGAAGFIVFDDTTDFAAVAHGVSRFLAVESCGQCAPCKQDGLALAGLLDAIRRSDTNDRALVAVDDRLRTITDSARCFLASQHQRVVGSIVEHFGDALRAHAEGKVDAAGEERVVAIRDLADGRMTLEEEQARKNPDWTFDAVDSGKTPAERLGDVHGAASVPRISAMRVPGTGAETDRREATHTVPAPPVHGIAPEALDPDDPEARLYTSEPIETDEGTVVVQQQNVGPGGEEGGGEWPDPHTAPQRPAPGAG